MLAPNGSGIDFQSLTVGNKKMGMSIVFDIEEGSNGEIWLATDNNGIIRITGKGTSMEDYHLESFTLGDGQINSIKAFCLYIDAHKHTWAGTDGGGLYLFDNKKSAFRSVHNCWNLLSDVVNSILGDSGDNLWLGTNAGLIKLNVRDLSKPVWKLYTVSDGLQDNFFNRNASFTAPTGEMFFGGLHGYNYFYPNQLTETNLLPSPAVITDIKIFNQPFENLKAREKTKISSVAPQFAKKIVLDYRHNNLNIEFTSLDYIDLSKNKYAYRLDGFDPDYVYTSQHFAYYNNLTPGKYTFLLKAANSNGIWQERSPLEVVVLPPPWKTIWAYLIYTILIAGMLIFAIYIARTRLIMRNNLSLKELEKKQMEELNHVKLQFFTNITHELLTPLTIISTALNELKTSLVNNDIYQIMESNTNRLMRLLQQIMEFRKAETGNLKLRVMKGDLAAFVRKTMESIRPLMKKKMLHISLVSNPDPFPAWFDPDKIDKIIYNLLSNASKYNREGGTVWIDVRLDETGYFALLSVKDDGAGIPKEQQKNLFLRFYEGEYRKFNTIGTGIGLSLTKDLVELHGGTITVESGINKGTTFFVKIPIKKEAYKDENIDENVNVSTGEQMFVPESEEKENSHPVNKEYSLLLLEDNEELLRLMVKLLSVNYIVFTGTNGKEGLEIIEQEDVDLIVSDIMMPEMDGIEFCRHIKNNIDTCHIPIILLTAKNNEEDRTEAYDSGANAFISKPFNLSLLHSRISNLLKARERVNRDFKKQLVFETQELNYTSKDEKFLQEAIRYVNDHLTDGEIDTPNLYKALNISKATLYRKLKSLTGLNVTAFVRNIRLKAACRIMDKKKNIRISEVAYAVGFNDPKYFSVCFKKELGMHPSDYLDQFADSIDLDEE